MFVTSSQAPTQQIAERAEQRALWNGWENSISLEVGTEDCCTIIGISKRPQKGRLSRPHGLTTPRADLGLV